MGYRIPSDGACDARLRMRLERAKQASETQETLVLEKVRRRVEHLAFEEDMRKWEESARFRMYLVADRLLERLERMLDDNVPDAACGEWNEEFRTAVERIPEARSLVEECLIMNVKG